MIIKDFETGSKRSAQVARIGEHGPLFELTPPHTIESLQESARLAAEQPRPLLCYIKHRNERVGKTYYNDDDLTGTVLSLVAAHTVDALVRCKRCGTVRIRHRP